MTKPTAPVRVYDAALIDSMADAHDERREAVKGTNRRLRASKALQARNAEVAALDKMADLVEAAKKAEYSQEAAEGLINQGEARAYARIGIIKGKTGSASPEVKAIKVKSDGSRDRLIDAARRRHGRETERPANHWDGTEGIQRASLKNDGVDTGEWFG